MTKDILETIKIPESGIGLIDSEKEIIGGLYGLVVDLMRDPAGTQYDKNDLLQRVRLQVGTEVDIFESFKEGLLVEFTQEELKKRCVIIRRDLRQFLLDRESDKILFDAAYKLKFQQETIEDRQRFIREICAKLEEVNQSVRKRDEAIKGLMDFSDPETVENVFAEVIEESDGLALLKTGWQDVNDMIGGGLKRGNFVLLSALQHNFKTGFTLNLFRQLAMYNTPYMLNPTKKPLMLRISFEDEIDVNARQMYSKIYEQKYNKPATFTGLQPKDIAKVVIDEMSQTGYHVMMLRVDPTSWSIFDLFNLVEELESDGYELHVVMVDYLKMLPTTGCTQGPMGSDIRDMFRRVRNFFSPRKILFITPHQLSTEAKQLIREGDRNFVKNIANKGYYDGCKTIDQEVDLEIHMHIEKMNGYSWLTLQRGKHRGAPIISDDMKYLVYLFHDIADIPDDLHGERTGRRKVGGNIIGQTPDAMSLDDFIL